MAYNSGGTSVTKAKGVSNFVTDRRKFGLGKKKRKKRKANVRRRK